MNLVGKIFTVLIFVMSLVFMSFAVVIYATHRNWKAVVERPEAEVGPRTPLGLKYQVEKLQTRNQELEDQKSELEMEVEKERLNRDQAVAKVESKYVELKDQHDELEDAYAKLVQERRDAQSALNSIQIVLGHLRKEIDTLRVNTSEAEADRDGHFKQVLKLTDELHQLVNEKERLVARQRTLAADLAQAEKVLRHYGHNKEDPLDSEPDVDGIVVAVTRPDLVEVSLGLDDGIKQGHKLEVFRVRGAAQSYVGRIFVASASFDRAACKVDPKYLKSPIQRGDRVKSRLTN